MDLAKITTLKGEFKAKGISRDATAAQVAFGTRHGLPSRLEIGGLALLDLHLDCHGAVVAAARARREPLQARR